MQPERTVEVLQRPRGSQTQGLLGRNELQVIVRGMASDRVRQERATVRIVGRERSLDAIEVAPQSMAHGPRRTDERDPPASEQQLGRGSLEAASYETC